MALYKKQFSDIISDTLNELGLYSEDALNLLLGTAAQESAFGTYIKQKGNGPALGVFQMEPNTFNDIVNNWLRHDSLLYSTVLHIVGQEGLKSDRMQWDLKLAIVMCRLHYRRIKESLPNTIEGYAYYWKKYYNTYLGAGTEKEFISNYKKYVL